MRADLELLYHFEPPAKAALTCPIFAFGGTRDHELPVSLISRWRDFTDRRFDLQMLDGDHFFINANPRPLQQLVGRALTGLPIASSAAAQVAAPALAQP